MDSTAPRPAGFYESNVGFIEAAGPDARSYLQNLTTNDIRPLTAGTACETFFTTHKARTIAHVILHCTGAESFLLAVDDGRADALFTHLDRHLISERVELTRRADLASLRVVGPLPETFSRKPGSLLYDAHAPVAILDHDFIGPAADIDATRAELESRGEMRLSAGVVEAIRIESGWPAWGKEMDENRFVVELGRTGAVSYAKGCYLGQEPIVMARDRGQVNRHLMGFRSAAAIPEGATIKQGEIELFRATSVAQTQKGTIGLAFVRGRPEVGATMVVPTGADGQDVQLLALPMV